MNWIMVSRVRWRCAARIWMPAKTRPASNATVEAAFRIVFVSMKVRLLRFDFYVSPGRVTERFEPPVAGFARGYFGAGEFRQPRVPIRPPGARMFFRARLPFLDGRWQLVVRPILVFLRRRRIDHAGDMAAARDDVADRPLE